MTPEGGHPLFEFRDVTVSLSGRTLIKGMNWRLDPGEVAVILGPSGSGKSVFLSTLLGFLTPDSGKVSRPGETPADLFRQVSVLFQEDALLDDRPVEENLAIARLERVDISPDGVSKELSQEIDRALRDVGLDPANVRRQLPAHLSGGMRRRVALARALLREPRVLLADEPTSGLDPRTAESIYELMHRLILERGLSAVIISHDPRCAELLGNPIYEFTPMTGQLRQRTPEGSPPPQREIAVPAAATRDAGEAPRFSLFGRVMDVIGRGILDLQPMLAMPRSAMLGEALIQYGVKSAGLVALIFVISGLVVQIQAERAVVDLGFSNRIPELFALALSRTAPLVVGVLLAGRCGSSVSAQTGWRVLSSQYRALRTMRIDPDQVFLPAIVWSWVLAAPLLMALGGAGATAAALLFLGSPFSQAQITPTYFLNVLPEFFGASTILTMIVKGVFMSGGAAAIAYLSGSSPKRSSAQVMQSMTGALVISFIWLACVDLLFSLVLPS